MQSPETEAFFFLYCNMMGTGSRYRNEGDTFWHDCLVQFMFQWLTGSDLVPYISPYEQRRRRYAEERDRQAGTPSVVVPNGVKYEIVAPLEINVAPYDNRKPFAIWELELMPESRIVELMKSRLGPSPSSMEDGWDSEIRGASWHSLIWGAASWDSELWQTDDFVLFELERFLEIDDISQYTNTRPRGRMLYVSQQLEIAKKWTDAQTISIKRQRTISKQWHDAMRQLTRVPLFSDCNHLSHLQMQREKHVKLMLECAKSGVQILSLFSLSLLPTSPSLATEC